LPDCAPDPRIQHIVVLMLENRSFDHMLGFAFQGNPNVEGLPADLSKVPPNLDSNKKAVLPTSEAEYAGDFYPDPGHDFADVQVQLYNGAAPGKGPSMEGFVQSYLSVCQKPENVRFFTNTSPADHSRRIMRGYHPSKVPVLATLAKNYAVCDHWFCSVPAETLPNRMFVHAGTSLGRLDLSVIEFDVDNTIYQMLDGDNVSSVIYADGWTAAATIRHLVEYQNRFFGTLDDFYQDCAENNLPAYSFLEPRYGSGFTNGTFRPENDQHPDSDVRTGEELLFSVYQAIRGNREVWKSTMLVVVYDEHGGLFDHVPPPKTVAPDARRDPAFPNFAFDLLGPRVPAVIVSAYTEAGTVLHDVYDHTSIIATARKMLTGKCNDPALGARAQVANTFEGALTRPAGNSRSDHVPIHFQIDHHPDVTKRPPNALQLKWKSFAKHVNSTLPAAQRSSIDPDSLHTDQDVQRYLESVYAGVRGLR
jgi:phospholipase C